MVDLDKTSTFKTAPAIGRSLLLEFSSTDTVRLLLPLQLDTRQSCLVVIMGLACPCRKGCWTIIIS
jgi:hypothetical protein